MKNLNIGIVNFIISNKLKESYFNNNLIEESKEMTFNFLDVVKNSPILQLEFEVFNNLENKFIDNDITAARYIDNNIKLFEVYTLQELKNEHKKLKSFLTENEVPIDTHKMLLYKSINTLIKESLKTNEEIDVDKIHESFTFVLNHIKEPKKTTIFEIDDKSINEEVIEVAINKFNEKYKSLNEDDMNLVQNLIKLNDKEKENLLETYKSETISLLENMNNDNVKDNILKSIQKIKGMNYNKFSVDDNIISLHELKKDLL